MPHMQRLTWNGVALHGGPLPGYAASHGCVRMPYGFAKQLFDKTRIGMRIIISPDDATPVDFSHAALPVPDAAAIAAAPGRADTLVRAAEDAATAADRAKKAAATAAREAASATASQHRLERARSKADAALARADKALAAARARQAARAEQLQRKVAAAEAAAVPQPAPQPEARSTLDAASMASEVARADLVAARAEDLQLKAAAGTATAGAEPDAAKAAAKAKRDAAAAAKAKRDVAAAAKEVARADEAAARAESQQLQAAARATAAATQLAAASADATAKHDAAATAKEVAKTAADRMAEAAAAAKEAKLELEPVSIYISRATQKLYVRRNTHKRWPDGGEVFDASIEAPITIRDPDRPIGTHIFTAMAQDGPGLRWSAVTIDNGDDASNALDRITIPADVLARIAPTTLPRSSIVVSDEPLSRETNYRTEFVAVLSNQPQGGFKTRRPTVSPRVPREDAWGYGGFGIFYQNDPDRQGYQRRRRGGHYQLQPGWWW
jgi:hypothetical protein